MRVLDHTFAATGYCDPAQSRKNNVSTSRAVKLRMRKGGTHLASVTLPQATTCFVPSCASQPQQAQQMLPAEHLKL